MEAIYYKQVFILWLSGGKFHGKHDELVYFSVNFSVGS